MLDHFTVFFTDLSSSSLMFSLSNIQLRPVTEFLILVFVFSVLEFIQTQVLTMFSSIFFIISIIVMFLCDDDSDSWVTSVVWFLII